MNRQELQGDGSAESGLDCRLCLVDPLRGVSGRWFWSAASALNDHEGSWRGTCNEQQSTELVPQLISTLLGLAAPDIFHISL